VPLCQLFSPVALSRTLRNAALARAFLEPPWRLIGAAESPDNTYAYAYDNAGNRTSVQVNGGAPTTFTYNAANEVAGWTYDAAGNLIGDGTASSTYDALNRTTAVTAGSQTRTNRYNGDGVLVTQVANSVTTRYTQDLAAPLTQILQTTQGSTTTNYLYGAARLASLSGSTRTWYAADALGSVRRTLSDTGTPNAPVNYDPWGTPEMGSVPTFGFTGELQDTATGLVNLRARWYSTARGTFTKVETHLRAQLSSPIASIRIRHSAGKLGFRRSPLHK
jgi:RHS repeat-associated protein